MASNPPSQSLIDKIMTGGGSQCVERVSVRAELQPGDPHAFTLQLGPEILSETAVEIGADENQLAQLHAETVSDALLSMLPDQTLIRTTDLVFGEALSRSRLSGTPMGAVEAACDVVRRRSRADGLWIGAAIGSVLASAVWILSHWLS